MSDIKVAVDKEDKESSMNPIVVQSQEAELYIKITSTRNLYIKKLSYH